MRQPLNPRKGACGFKELVHRGSAGMDSFQMPEYLTYQGPRLLPGLSHSFDMTRLVPGDSGTKGLSPGQDMSPTSLQASIFSQSPWLPITGAALGVWMAQSVTNVTATQSWGSGPPSAGLVLFSRVQCLGTPSVTAVW